MYRPTSPAQHSQFLHYVSAVVAAEDNAERPTHSNTQEDCDAFYDDALRLLNCFYPERTVTTTSRDPHFITPGIKAKLRRENRLRRAGRFE